MRNTALAVITTAFLLTSFNAFAHCDTMSGPVISDAKIALAKGDVTPVLKWVHADQEAVVRDAFKAAIAARKAPATRDAAEQNFFDTLVKVHREGEGAPFTGVKPAGTPNEPGVDLADAALESGNPDEMVRKVNLHITEGIRSRYARTSELRKHANDSVEAGREYVEAYVDYVHYVMGIAMAAHKEAGHSEAHSEHVH